MVQELIYSLTDPNYTIYHRAALGGLAATIHAWEANKPQGVEAEIVDWDCVRLAWGNNITDQEALQRILSYSFQLDNDTGMINK